MTDQLRKAAEMALKLLENNRLRTDEHLIPIVVDDLRNALAQDEQEPVLCGCGDGIVANDEAKCGVCVMRLENQIERLKAQPEQEPVAYLYHDTACAELANPLAGSTLLVLACDRKPNGRNETPLYTAPPSKQEPVEYDAPALYKAKAEREQAEKQESYLVAVIGNWGRVEWVDGVYPQIGDRMYSAPPSKP